MATFYFIFGLSNKNSKFQQINVNFSRLVSCAKIQTNDLSIESPSPTTEQGFHQAYLIETNKRTLTLGGSVTIWLVYNFTVLNSTVKPKTNNHIFSHMINSNIVKLKPSCTAILPSAYDECSLYKF